MDLAGGGAAGRCHRPEFWPSGRLSKGGCRLVTGSNGWRMGVRAARAACGHNQRGGQAHLAGVAQSPDQCHSRSARRRVLPAGWAPWTACRCRLAAFVVAPGLSSQDLLAALRQRIDAVSCPVHCACSTFCRAAAPASSPGRRWKPFTSRPCMSEQAYHIWQVPVDHPAFAGHFRGAPSCRACSSSIRRTIAQRMRPACSWQIVPSKFCVRSVPGRSCNSP